MLHATNYTTIKIGIKQFKKSTNNKNCNKQFKKSIDTIKIGKSTYT